jgi:outer membrane protein OmpA-like peptidoglycan-associated protein
MQAAATTAVDSGSAMGLLNVDGNPQLVAASAFSDPSAGNTTALDVDKANYLLQFKTAVAQLRAKAPHVSVLEALDKAGRAVRAACRHGGTIYLADSGLSDTGPVDFCQQGLLQANPADVVAFLRREGDLPHLKGISVVLVGIGDTAPPQHPLSISQRTNLIAIWSAIVKAGGASSVQVDPAPRSGLAPSGVPTVTLVPVPRTPTWKPSDRKFSLPDSGPVGFQPNTAVFRDPVGAAAALKKIAEYLIANPSAKITLSGTTAHWPPGPSSLASDKWLGFRRALACKAVLVRLGVARGRIAARGLGWKFPGYENDQGPDGTLLPGPAEHNRSVILSWR